MAKIKNTDIVMLNTKFGILVTSEEEGGWDRGNTKGAPVVFVIILFLRCM